MVDYREILRHKSLGSSLRQTMGAVHCSDYTVKVVWEVADRLGVHWPLDDDVTNSDLERLLFPDKYKNVCLYVEPDYPYIHKELAKNSVPRTCLLRCCHAAAMSTPRPAMT